MKILFHFVFSTLILMSVASCNSDSDSIDSEPDENKQPDIENKGELYTFSYSIKVNDSEGNNLLNSPEEYKIDYYNEWDIIMKYANDSDAKVLFIISKNKSNETLLNITVEGEYLDSKPIQEMTVQWGTTLMATTDLLKYELEKAGDNIQCKKIWFNDELKWENNNPDFPILSIVKAKNISFLPQAEPISLKYPEKIKSENQFALNLFKKAILDDSRNGNVNTFVSPLSVNLALNMLVNGADGETKEEILKTLESGGFSIDQINEHSKELSKALTSVDPSTTLSIANSIWPSIIFPVKETFIQTNINYYDAEVNPLDFTSNDALGTINKWCADKTKNMIPKALDELSEDTQLVLINALYFKSNWSRNYEFDEDQTKKEPFYAVNSLIEEVDMMHKTDAYLYKSNSYASFLKIPFGNYAFDMVIILPDEDKTMQEVIDNIENDLSWTTNKNMDWKEINLSLPKFKLDFSYKMNEYILPEMGMKIPFTHNADFKGISDTDLLITKVIHKTAIEVKESGAAAAAITIILGETSTGHDTPEPKRIDFNVNRPFIFSICEKSTGSILFIGKINRILQ